MPASRRCLKVSALASPRVVPGYAQHMSDPAANFTPDFSTRCTMAAERCRTRSLAAASLAAASLDFIAADITMHRSP